MAERYYTVSKDAAIGLVMLRKAMSYDAAKAWLAAQVALGAIKPELYRGWPPYRLAEIEAALVTADLGHRRGRPSEPYKETVIEKTRAWLARQPNEPRMVRVREAIERVAWDLGHDPSDGTTKNWAREVLTEHRKTVGSGKKGNK